MKMWGYATMAAVALAIAGPAGARETAGTCAAAAGRPVLVCEGASCMRLTRQALCQALGRTVHKGEARRRPVAAVADDTRAMEEAGRRQLAALIEGLR